MVPILLHGTPEQQNTARTFLSTKLNKTTKEACDALVEKLMAVAHKDDEGVWVRTPEGACNTGRTFDTVFSEAQCAYV